jgi:hypothetical protein
VIALTGAGLVIAIAGATVAVKLGFGERVATVVQTESPRQGPEEPAFATKEQARRYYRSVVDGERSALEVVEQALERAHTTGGSAAEMGRLESLKAEYAARLHQHQAELER